MSLQVKRADVVPVKGNDASKAKKNIKNRLTRAWAIEI